jgi:hypothetical protein
MQMFFDDQHNVLLIRFEDDMTAASLVKVTDLTEKFVAKNGMCDGILDFTGVRHATVTAEQIRAKSDKPPVLVGRKRIIVAPDDLIYALCRMFQTNQSIDTEYQCEVVRSLTEALILANIRGEHFRPVDENTMEIKNS